MGKGAIAAPDQQPSVNGVTSPFSNLSLELPLSLLRTEGVRLDQYTGLWCAEPARFQQMLAEIRAGDLLALFYPSANRDEEVFDEPFRFRVERSPNRHLSFGIGEHFCLGAHVARVELRVAFRHLIGRLVDAELASPIERLRSSQVGGIKRLPIRYRLRPAA